MALRSWLDRGCPARGVRPLILGIAPACPLVLVVVLVVVEHNGSLPHEGFDDEDDDDNDND